MDVTLRELGGSMAPIWPTYYKDSPAIVVGDQLDICSVEYCNNIYSPSVIVDKPYAYSHTTE